MTGLWIAIAVIGAASPQPSGGRARPEPGAASESPAAGVADDDRWLIGQARDEFLGRGIAQWSGDVASGIKSAPAVSATDPALRELEPLLKSIAGREPAGIAPRQAPVQIPQPWWSFAWWDVDGDDRKEIVLAAGTSPAPYYAVFQRIEDSKSWRILHEAPFRFVGSASRAGRIYLFGVFDGYGIAGPALEIDSVASGDGGAASKRQIRVALSQWPAVVQGKDAIAAATTNKATKLRSSPERDDKPSDNGMGGASPGNLVQALAAGSTGWTLHTEKGKDGHDWTLCCFVGTSPMRSERPREEMLTPKKLVRQSLQSARNLLVGWLPTRDLVVSPAGL